MLWATSPACTELETHVLDWLVGMLGLPENFLSTSRGGGVIQDTASSAALCALLAARERATNYTTNRKGCDGKLVAYASTQTHSSLEKAAMIAGLGVENLRLIEVDEKFAMRPEALARQIEADKRAGLVPTMVCATVGTTSSNAMDPVVEIERMMQVNCQPREDVAERVFERQTDDRRQDRRAGKQIGRTDPGDIEARQQEAHVNRHERQVEIVNPRAGLLLDASGGDGAAKPGERLGRTVERPTPADIGVIEPTGLNARASRADKF